MSKLCSCRSMTSATHRRMLTLAQCTSGLLTPRTLCTPRWSWQRRKSLLSRGCQFQGWNSGAGVLAKLLHCVKEIFRIPLSSVFAWTDSTIVLDWLVGNPRRFKTYVENHVSEIIVRVPADRWSHVAGSDNPADCASRGVLPSQLLEHDMWWTGFHWLFLSPEQRPKRENTAVKPPAEEEKEVCLATVTLSGEFIIPIEHYSTLT